MPCSRARSMMLWLSSTSVTGPKFIVPRHSRLTERPVRPRCVYSMASSLPRRLMRVAVGLVGAALAVGALAVPAGAALAASGAPGPSASALFSLFSYADPQITESSGIAASSFDDTFYTHNDSGDSARFFRVDAHGNTVAVYTLRGATNVDWEDMATGTDAAGHRVLYFGDIGDNDRKRSEIAVYQVPEPRGASSDVTWVRYRFAYPDGSHDAEALLVNPRD